jgi:hypothetical protein
LELKNVTHGMTIDDFVQIAPLNEVLKEMARPEVEK